MAVGYSLMLWDNKTTYTIVGVRKQHSNNNNNNNNNNNDNNNNNNNNR